VASQKEINIHWFPGDEIYKCALAENIDKPGGERNILYFKIGASILVEGR